MYRATTSVLLIYGALLMPAQAGGSFPSAGDRRTDSRIENGHSSGKKMKEQRLPGKNPALAIQASGLRDVAMHSPIRRSDPREQAASRIEEVAGPTSWLAMLVAGLGVALISICRRIGGQS